MLKLGLRRTLRRHDCATRSPELTEGRTRLFRAGVAQLVEHLICNQRVGGSSPFASSRSLTADEEFGFGCTVRTVLAGRPPETSSTIETRFDQRYADRGLCGELMPVAADQMVWGRMCTGGRVVNGSRL